MSLWAPAARAMRIVDYNVTNYPSVLFPQRQPYFRTIFAPLGAHVVVCQEFTSQAGVDSFRTNVLNANEPGQWASAPFFNGNDTNNALFYKPSKVQVLGAWPFYPDPTTNLRYVTVWRLKPVGYTSGAAEFRIYGQHLKASQGVSCSPIPCETRRLNECIGIRDSMNAMPAGTRAIALGDWNFYKSSTEPGYWKLQENQVNNIGRLLDPQNPTAVTQDWHDNPSFANVFTQCPCVTCPTGSGFSGGGLDDRFDQILPTPNFQTGQGLSILPATYIVVGEDGQHWNKNITDPPTIPEGAAYATALWNASDHLPSRIDLQLPAQVGAIAPLAFGTAIVGASVSQKASVPDTAHVPADSLRFTAACDPGFTTPAGPQAVAAGSAALVNVTLDTSAPAAPSGNLTIASNDPDHPTTLVGLSGTVVAHASASLDSAAAMLADSIDFGAQPAGGFTAHDIRVHNRGYNALQARLALGAATFAGGDGRFSIVGGFSPLLLSGVGQSYSIVFADGGATPDSEYTATLTISSADEPLPGTAARPDLVIGLMAQVASGTTGIETLPHLPTATRLYAPVPNPLTHASYIRFDLARRAPVRLEVFDLSGRRVSMLASREFEPGRYGLHWDGRGPAGALGPGLYFVRLTGVGFRTQAVRVAIVR
jgi:hypothetical protein